jgi:Alpha/beta hydrolase of unknown function (DUF900)
MLATVRSRNQPRKPRSADVAKIVGGMTLYASSTDKALEIARSVAKAPRAGDIFNGEPLIVTGMDTIDVTSVGNELFGLNHGVYAATRSLVNDIKILLKSKVRPPNERIPEIRPVPEGLGIAAKYWRFAP